MTRARTALLTLQGPALSLNHAFHLELERARLLRLVVLTPGKSITAVHSTTVTTVLLLLQYHYSITTITATLLLQYYHHYYSSITTTTTTVLLQYYYYYYYSTNRIQTSSSWSEELWDQLRQKVLSGPSLLWVQVFRVQLRVS